MYREKSLKGISEVVMAALKKPQKLKIRKDQIVTVYAKMSEEDKEETNQDNVVSYFKSLTLEKKYGTTGSIEMEQGAVYIGDLNLF